MEAVGVRSGGVEAVGEDLVKAANVAVEEGFAGGGGSTQAVLESQGELPEAGFLGDTGGALGEAALLLIKIEVAPLASEETGHVEPADGAAQLADGIVGNRVGAATRAEAVG